MSVKRAILFFILLFLLFQVLPPTTLAERVVTAVILSLVWSITLSRYDYVRAEMRVRRALQKRNTCKHIAGIRRQEPENTTYWESALNYGQQHTNGYFNNHPDAYFSDDDYDLPDDTLEGIEA